MSITLWSEWLRTDGRQLLTSSAREDSPRRWSCGLPLQPFTNLSHAVVVISRVLFQTVILCCLFSLPSQFSFPNFFIAQFSVAHFPVTVFFLAFFSLPLFHTLILCCPVFILSHFSLPIFPIAQFSGCPFFCCRFFQLPLLSVAVFAVNPCSSFNNRKF